MPRTFPSAYRRTGRFVTHKRRVLTGHAGRLPGPLTDLKTACAPSRSINRSPLFLSVKSGLVRLSARDDSTNDRDPLASIPGRMARICRIAPAGPGPLGDLKNEFIEVNFDTEFFSAGEAVASLQKRFANLTTRNQNIFLLGMIRSFCGAFGLGDVLMYAPDVPFAVSYAFVRGCDGN